MQRVKSSHLLHAFGRRLSSLSPVNFRALVAVLLLASAATANASGPRWVSGPPYFNQWNVLISWYTNHPAYFTDPGDLSPSVNHAAADAMVAQAAAVWNVQTSSLVLAQGGTLNEHLSGANVYADANGLVFPADVLTSNYAAKPIAIIYDTDGSITDMLLGSGASDPIGCLQTGVTESVDSITPEARIQHAILILNGRCTGPQPEKQLQMQYQLMRAFGRILGLGWSQTNDNVFTGSPMPTHMQAMNWPIMHPIDIICGPYTYQCLPQPFTLRADDISSLEQLYFIPQSQAAPGKLASFSNAGDVLGKVTFPNGQGMEGVNVVIRRRAPFWDQAEEWQTASSVSGYAFRGRSATSITATDSSAAASAGAPYADGEGYWRIQALPVPPDQAFTDLLITTEPINPLYTGLYAIGPLTENTISPSGTSVGQISYILAPGRENYGNFAPADAASTCATPTDGTESAPAAVSGAGWWNGTLCGYGHAAWSALAVKANRTLTLEVTALDEKGFVSMTKAMPIVGVWNSTDPTGTLPTVAAAGTAFNSFSVGMTTLQLQSSAVTTFRIAVQDQRGAGRPDFAYQARALYADTVTPANVAAAGGAVTITGMGFRQGNTVLVNGIAATITSWSPTSISATLPSLHDLGLSHATVANITVEDVATGGTSVMSEVLRYAAPVEALQLVTAPSGTVAVGAVAAIAFSVRAIAPDGFTPIVGEAVSFAATGTGARLNSCGSATCSILTNSAGVAGTSVTPGAPGAVTLTAAGRSGTATASFTATSVADVLHLLGAPTGIITTGVAAVTPLRVQLLLQDGVTPRTASSLTLTMANGSARFGACTSVPCTLTTDASGIVTTTVTPTSSGVIAVQFSSASSSVTASFSSALETMHLTSAPSSAQTSGTTSLAAFAVKVLAGDGVTPVAGEAVVFTAAGAPVSFGACGGAVCTLTTDAQGIAQSPVTPNGAGVVTLSAVGSAGTVTAAFSVSTRVRSVTSARPVQYIAEGLLVAWTPQVVLFDNSASTAGQPISWTGTPGLSLSGSPLVPQAAVAVRASAIAAALVTGIRAKGLSYSAATSISDAAGVARGGATAGPLAAGTRAQGYACAWISVCTPVIAQAVGAGEWRIATVSGSAQTVSAGGALAPVLLRIVNANGDPIAGVPVQIEQTVSAWEAACLDTGRCPLASTLAATRASAVSDTDGLISVLPAQITGVPTVTRIAAIAGLAGFATLSVEAHP